MYIEQKIVEMKQMCNKQKQMLITQMMINQT